MNYKPWSRLLQMSLFCCDVSLKYSKGFLLSSGISLRKKAEIKLSSWAESLEWFFGKSSCYYLTIENTLVHSQVLYPHPRWLRCIFVMSYKNKVKIHTIHIPKVGISFQSKARSEWRRSSTDHDLKRYIQKQGL